MNTLFYRPAAGTDYPGLARAGRALQGRAVREALVRFVRRLGNGVQGLLIGTGASRHA
ncbi:MAG: hypothetical protein J4F47_00585 [Alphaproteobacteria bacterium]|nr:hypothetical protein [Alphaproteobacteria bacterium]